MPIEIFIYGRTFMAEALKGAIYRVAVTPVDVQWLNYKPCRIEQDENDEDPSESRYL